MNGENMSIVTGGHTANLNGNDFEASVESVINSKTGYSSVINSKAKRKTDVLIRQYAYTTMYGHDGRLDYMLNYGGKSYFIECKLQTVAGSVDEKLPYTLMNMNQHDGVKIIIIDGDGWKDGAVDWLYNASKNTDVLVMNLKEFKKFVSKFND